MKNSPSADENPVESYKYSHTTFYVPKIGKEKKLYELYNEIKQVASKMPGYVGINFNFQEIESEVPKGKIRYEPAQEGEGPPRTAYFEIRDYDGKEVKTSTQLCVVEIWENNAARQSFLQDPRVKKLLETAHQMIAKKGMELDMKMPWLDAPGNAP